jgi:branched-chain amino acid transport system permease protein
MTGEILLLLAQDGITNGAIYALLALCLVLVYSVTRVVFVPQGEFVTYGAMTLAAIQNGVLPGTIWIVMGLGLWVFLVEAANAIRVWQLQRLLAIGATYLLAPAALVVVAGSLPLSQLPYVAQVLLTFFIVVPIGPLVYRTFFQPIADATVLLLLIVAVAIHLAMTGLGLLVFGPEGVRTTPLTSAYLSIGDMSVSWQSMWMISASLALMAALYYLFERTLIGKALRATAANRVGARIVGIRPRLAGSLCFSLAAAIGTLSGVLISAITTIYYDSGLLIALKGFVGAIIGGLVSYPLAAAGAVVVGLLEVYSSFWASAYKEVIVFTLIIPVLLWRSLRSPHVGEEE